VLDDIDMIPLDDGVLLTGAEPVEVTWREMRRALAGADLEGDIARLRSRGIDEEEARRLVVHGFFADIIRRIGVRELEARLLAAVEAELASVGVE